MGLAEFREKLKENPGLRYGITAALAALCLFLVLRWFLSGTGGDTPPPPITKWYFYNVKTKKLFPVDAATEAPIDTDSGPKTGVRAMVFACGDCSDQTKHFIGYLQSRKPFQKSMLNNDKSAKMFKPGVTMVEVIREPDSNKWVLVNSKEGAKIQGKVQQRCGDQHTAICHPHPEAE